MQSFLSAPWQLKAAAWLPYR